MKILAIDTATEACSVALMVDNDIQERCEKTPRGHAEKLLFMIEELLAVFSLRQAELDAIAFGKGPGSFTGLRIAAGVTQGIALALDLPVLAISSLQALAQAAYSQYKHPNILAVLDARMQEVYFGQYQHDARLGIVTAINQELLCRPDSAPIPQSGHWLAVGSGWLLETLQQRFQDTVDKTDTDIYPQASAILTLARYYYQHGESIAAEQVVSSYLRNKVVT